MTLALALLASLPAAEAQQAGRVYRVGVLGTSDSPAWQAFLEGLRELGWAEGKNIVTERRFSEGKQERLRDLAAELVRLNVDVIVTSTTPPTLAAKNATTTIPIVMVAVGDPSGGRARWQFGAAWREHHRAEHYEPGAERKSGLNC